MAFRILIVSLVGFEKLPDVLKSAIFEKRIIPFTSLILIINQQNSEFFLGKLQLIGFKFFNSKTPLNLHVSFVWIWTTP